MLHCQDLGGSHQDGLVTVSHGQQHRVLGNHGLAAADIPLQQPVHGDLPAHVGGDLGDHALLGCGQLEWKPVEDALVDLLGRGKFGGQAVP